MDPECGVASGGSFISLDENEQRYYSGLHNLCQSDSAGKLSASKVGELFKASQLPPEALHQVTEVCGAKRLGYFGTTQFYVALKLLAAAQSGLPIRLESVTTTLPPPRFVGLKNEPEPGHSTFPQSVDAQGLQCGASAVSVPWTPTDRSAFRHQEGHVEKKELWSPPRSPCSSPPRSPSSSRNYPYSMQRNGTDSQMAYDSKHSARPVVQLEQHSSPNKYGTKPSVDHLAMPRAASVERLDQRGVMDYSEDDPWRITEEQREYYTNQFKTLQPDLGALILGTFAKNFFTKSKLPIPELSHIWELSDVDRDGALTFSEFCTAFHLIVARKNGYPLPETLPPTLWPGFIEQEEDIPETPESADPLIVFEDAEPRPNQLDRSVVERLQPGVATAMHNLKEESCKPDLTSKGLATFQTKHTLQVGAFPGGPETPHDLDPQMKARTRPRSYSSTSIDDAMKKTEEPPTPPPRPQKTHSRASSLDLNKLLQQGAQGVKSGWLPPPPALPPRPSATQAPHFMSATEKTPQKAVQQPNFADFSQFREEEEAKIKLEEKGTLRRAGPSSEDLTNAQKQDRTGISHNQPPQKPIRRKYHPENPNLEATPPPTVPFAPPTASIQKLLSRQRREIQMAIRKNKETNAVLTRLNSELQQQLKEVHQERITLESQLELLRPLTSL
ncbi:ralBP1-associated Eps domain-containing protein 2 [Lampris incognitus]|uniref:ralBP1-associated Eps domain-containing protein 2 n=1 Tax=Lampris incognitus TaxID=2546036 RepID=UPI0024B5271F|nr:ralBP1-associated Eps domain-containing protein 2 [Lampris incognitus]